MANIFGKVIYVIKMKFKIGIPATHEYKEEMMEEYANEYGCNVLIETGTYKGDMLVQVYELFEYLASVEISSQLYEEAKKRFENDIKIHLYNGNSSDKLPQMIDDAKGKIDNARIIFWLDGHYSGGVTEKAEKDTPIVEELLAIKKQGIDDGVILIDDARCFKHKGEYIDYPTIKSLKKIVHEQWENAAIQVKNDIIRIVL
ncbi:hypothetical protein [Butyrivibrio sp. INlla14]|uniref:hypothetical protein n=1 Tax=Butyrivibrio sp. INlla14 TaxID=1520808 RepID=UPI000876582E|nr:hypothetical protein [Butyrivibrio sp. INlla14]SCX84365.1 hypothetical protein SAMN02910371_00164 [Butyrivibrio sp. INlla14]